MAGPKIHPLWFSEFIPVMFFVSSIFAGLSIVIIEASIATKVFSHVMDDEHRKTHRRILIGLARVCAGAMFAYLIMQVIVFIHGGDAAYMTGGMAAWWLVEIVGFTAIPAVLFVVALRRRRHLRRDLGPPLDHPPHAGPARAARVGQSRRRPARSETLGAAP